MLSERELKIISNTTRVEVHNKPIRMSYELGISIFIDAYPLLRIIISLASSLSILSPNPNKLRFQTRPKGVREIGQN